MTAATVNSVAAVFFSGYDGCPIMKITIIEPYDTGSHAAWARGYQRNSRHDVDIMGLAGRNWKWRMHGGAVTLARRYLASGARPDLFLATDMLDLTTFRALIRDTQIPVAVYFHENQLSYPWSPGDRDVRFRRDRHYGFINYTTALAADAVLFNSRYHMTSFLEELNRLLRHFPDHRELDTVDEIAARSSVLPLGIDLRRFDAHRCEREGKRPLLLWNHRWEYDKNPNAFFAAAESLLRDGFDFEVAVLGESFPRRPTEFESARDWLGERIVHYGYAEDAAEYARWLWRADIVPVTSNQDFFGASIVEAVYCGCWPLLPRRLAYPELIPEQYASDVFYEDDRNMPERLAALCRDGAPAGDLRTAVAGYDWSVMAPVYDEIMENISSREHSRGGSL